MGTSQQMSFGRGWIGWRGGLVCALVACLVVGGPARAGAASEGAPAERELAYFVRPQLWILGVGLGISGGVTINRVDVELDAGFMFPYSTVSLQGGYRIPIATVGKTDFALPLSVGPRHLAAPRGGPFAPDSGPTQALVVSPTAEVSLRHWFGENFGLSAGIEGGVMVAVINSEVIERATGSRFFPIVRLNAGVVF